MGVRGLVVSSACMVLSFVGLHFWTELSIERLKSDGLIDDDYTRPENLGRVVVLLLGSSSAVILLLLSFVVNAVVLLFLCIKNIFFAELHSSESRKLVERLVNYVIYKGTFLPLIVPPAIFQAGLWSAWMFVLCFLKMFQALGRDRLERLNASPSATPWTYFRVYSVLLVVLTADLLWMRICWKLYAKLDLSMFLLLFYEPFSILFETLQAILVHGFQFFDIWLNHSAESGSSCGTFKYLDASVAGSLWEWKAILTRNMGFILDMGTLLMALGHYLHIWWLHGLAFHLVDVVLFLNIRALLSAIIKRVRGFIRLRRALGNLHAALPDATSDELQAYEDECAICREPMAKAKRLNCSHLFHLPCLRSWLDQGSNEGYSCPTCRKPLIISRHESEANHSAGELSSDERLARQLSSELGQQNPVGHTLPVGVFPNQTQNLADGGDWRDAGRDSWLHSWPGQDVDGAGPSSGVRSVGLARVQMMMRHLASVGETYAQTALEDSAWPLWPVNSPQATVNGSPISPFAGQRYTGGTSGLHRRTSSRSASDNITTLLAMAETVREVLPHLPDEIILQDLQRTNSATVTVNNLLQM